MNIQNFKTKSEIIMRDFPRIVGNNQHKTKTIVALDGGYSAVKGVSPNKVFTFPSLAKKAPLGLEIVGEVSPTDIQLRNNDTGEIWLVGGNAEKLLDRNDIDAITDASLYTRYRFDSPMYKTIMAAGLLLGLKNIGKTDEVFLQTGLPASYADSDKKKLVKALSGTYNYSIKVGNEPWWNAKFPLPEDNIHVIEQPQGTLCSCVYDNGLVSKEGAKLLTSNTLILDIGFGTEDIFSIRSGYKNGLSKTFPDTGMKSVFEHVLSQINSHCDTDAKVFEFQKYLYDGIFTYFNPETFSDEEYDFKALLDAANKELCEKSIKRLMQEYDNLQGYQYLIVTGGTGESRFTQIKDMLKGMKHIQILPGNFNTPELAFSYSNVIGYYMFRHANQLSESKKQK